MNLHGIVGPIVSAINPSVLGLVEVSTGSTMGPDYKQVPTYNTFCNVLFQVQPLSSSDLQQIDSVNLQSTMKAVYFNGCLEGLDRFAGRGGDVLIFREQRWLVTQVLEAWDTSGWCKVAVTLQGPT